VNLADATPELAPDTGATIGEDTAAGDPTEGQGDGE